MSASGDPPGGEAPRGEAETPANAETPHRHDRIMRVQEVARLLGISPSTVRRLAKRGTHGFPRPKSLFGRSVGWLHSDVMRWIQTRKTAGGGKGDS